ncbi:NB-ARC domain-containing protein [Streptomyces sp. NBC_01298]|uniref:NB-ARC domain-containing protein n=1 Tax=Streptomyces sp. NBC_01298 TaxID=2903817 RepID=UPI002E0D89CA|nr:NB-ARC domain-containing protein [Streptomyces sp. NBC_01298]
MLHGAGGCGKTTLAALVCADRRVRRRFRGGVYTIVMGPDLRGRAAIAAQVNELAELITGARPGFEDPDLAGRHLARILGGRRRTLLVVDDVWAEEQLAPFGPLGREAACLVTSRMPATAFPGAVDLPVGSLASRDAVSLLTWQLPHLPGALTQDLLDAAARWALVLRLMNRVLDAQVATGRDVRDAATDLLARLRSDGPGAVDPVGAPPAPADTADPVQRRRAVSTTIEAATDLLPAGGRDRLVELGLFAEAVPVPVALVHRLWAATSGADETAARDLCGRLARLSLVSLSPAGGGAVSLHAAVRAYLRGQCGPARLRALNASFLGAVAAGLPGPGGGRTPHWWHLDPAGYLAGHLVEHLIQAGRTAEAGRLVTDLRWVTARLAGHGPAAVLTDLAAAGTGTAAESLQAELARSAHLLGPTEPARAVVDVLLARLGRLPDWAAACRAFTGDRDRMRLVPARALPDTPDPALRRVLTGHTGAVRAVVVAPDGSWLATAGADGTVRVWDSATGAERRCLRGWGQQVQALAVNKGGTLLAASDGHTVVLHDLVSDTVLDRTNFLLDVHGLAFDEDDVVVIAVLDGVRLWTPGTRKVRLRPEGARAPRAAVPVAGGTVLVEAANVSLPRRKRHQPVRREGNVYVWDRRRRRQSAKLQGHTKVINDLAVAPDGTWAATASSDWTVRLWSLDTPGALRTLTGHLGGVNAVAIGPAGDWLASAGDDLGVRVWRAADGKLLAGLTGHRHPVTSLAVAPDGSWLASADRGGAVVLWDTAGDRSYVWEVVTTPPLWSLPLGDKWGGGLAVDPAGGWIAATSSGEIVVCALADGRELARMKPPGGGASSLAVAANGDRIVSGAPHAALTFWDTATWSRTSTVTTARGVTALAASQDGRWVAAGGGDRVTLVDVDAPNARATITLDHDGLRTLWTTPDGSGLGDGGEDGKVRIRGLGAGSTPRVFEGQVGRVNALAGAPDGSWLASAGDGGTVLVRDTGTGRLRATLTGAAGWLTVLAVAPDGTWIASAGVEGIVRVHDVLTGRLCAALPGTGGGVHALVVSADGTRLACAGNGRVLLWDTTELRAQVRAARTAGDTAGGEVHSAVFSPDGTWTAAIRAEHTVRTTEVATGTERVLVRHTGPLRDLAVAPDGSWIVTACKDGSARTWDAAAGTALRVFRARPTDHQGPMPLVDRLARVLRHVRDSVRVDPRPVDAVAVAPDDRWAAWVGGDGLLRVWDRGTDEVRAHLTGTRRALYALAATPDGHWLAYGGRDRAVRVWDVGTGRVVHRLRGHRGAVRAVAASPDGRLLASAGDDLPVRVWDREHGRAAGSFTGHTAPAGAVAFSPDGCWVASAGADGCLHVWDAATGRPAAVMRVDGGLAGCAWSPDGTLLEAGGSRGTYLFECRVPPGL